MTIIQRYLYREILQVFVAVLAVLLVVYVANQFVRFLTEATSGLIPSGVILKMVGIKVAANMVYFLPVGVFLAVLLALGRLYKDSEVVAMSAAGLGLPRIARAVLWVGLGFGLVNLWLSIFMGPRLQELDEKLIERARTEAQVSAILPGRFKEFSGGDHVVYVESIDAETGLMHNVFVKVTGKRREEVVVAKTARQSAPSHGGDSFIVLEDGYRYSGTPGSPDYSITRFETHAVRLDRIGRVDRGRAVESIPTLELWQTGGPLNLAELQWRIAMPVSLVLLSLLAVPLARTSPREGRYAKLFFAVIAYFLYSNAIGISQKLIEREELPAAVGMWPVHLVAAIAVAALLHRQTTGRWWPAAGGATAPPDDGHPPDNGHPPDDREA